MTDFSPKVLTSLDAFLTKKHIEFLKNKYIETQTTFEDEFHDVTDLPYEIDREKGILCYFYHDPEDGKAIYYDNKFEEDILAKKLKNIFEDILIEIESAFIFLGEYKAKEYCNRLYEKLKHIEKKESELFSLFGILGRFKKGILKHLEDKYSLIYEPYSYNYYFMPKNKEDIERKLITIYQFLESENWIKSSEKEFLAAFLEKKCHTPIKFQCKTPITVYLLEKISVLFTNMDRRKILSSKRFHTKQSNAFITQSNYSTAKSRLNNHLEEKEKIDIFFKKEVF